MTPDILWICLILLLGNQVTMGFELYSRDSPVILVDRCNWHHIVASARHTVLVKFYAPWCQYSVAMKAIYEEAAMQLQDLAVTAAIDCEDEDSVWFCRRMGIEAFPTLKIFTPSNDTEPFSAQDFTGERSVEAIVKTATDNILNTVDHVQEARLAEWHAEQDNNPTAVFYSPVKSTSVLLKIVAIDLSGIIKIAQVYSLRGSSMNQYSITSLPALIVRSNSTSSPILYQGDWSRSSVITFLLDAVGYSEDFIKRRAGPLWKTHTGPAGAKNITTCGDSIVTVTVTETGTPVTVFTTAWPTVTIAHVTTVTVNVTTADLPARIHKISTEEDFRELCLQTKVKICILILHPEDESIRSNSETASASISDIIQTLSEIFNSTRKSQERKFSIHAVEKGTAFSKAFHSAFRLQATSHVGLVALDVRGKWARTYSSQSYEMSQMEEFIDTSLLDEGLASRIPIPDSLLLGTLSERNMKDRHRDEL